MSLAGRFRDRLRELGAPESGDRVVVAVSGGLDSLVLLHLLRFTRGLPEIELVAAHLDHGMRPDSAADAAWVRGLTEAWGVAVRVERTDREPSDEATARELRYRFLREVKEEVDAAWILTAHHADDQAETVLFRTLRGTGIRGLRGIPVRRDPGILRPLLTFWRAELEAYAGATGIDPRTDPTNVDPGHARNVVRHELLPRAEEAVAPGARKALVRLARLARREEEAWEALGSRLLEPVLLDEQEDDGRFVLDRRAFLAYDSTVRARLLRQLLRRVGVRLDEAGTREAVQFTSSSTSGQRLDLPHQMILTREFDRLVLRRARERGPDEALIVPAPDPGDGEFVVGGRAMRARWSVGSEPSGAWVEHFSPSGLRFPLRIRGWDPGDRIRFPYGSKKLKKVFGEHRIPVHDRHRWPVLADAEGTILWIPGLARSDVALPEADEENAFALGIADADD